MAEINLINADSATIQTSADIILTDPPFDLRADRLAEIIANYRADHLILLTTMRQLVDFLKATRDWELSFDFVFNSVQPKHSKNRRQPNYVHVTGAYLIKHNVKSVFDRKKRQRSDTFVFNGYWPTIFNAPRQNVQQHGHAKNTDAVTDLLGSFAISSVIDIFSGLGTTGIAANNLGIDCTLIEKNEKVYTDARQLFKFLNIKFKETI